MKILEEANVRQVPTDDISALSTAMKCDKNYARMCSRIWAQHLVHEAGAKPTSQRSFPGQGVSKTASKSAQNGHLLHRVNHVTVSRFFLACAAKCHEERLSREIT